jgi:hypothetical protein
MANYQKLVADDKQHQKKFCRNKSIFKKNLMTLLQ